MPVLRFPVLGSRVITHGSVIKRPPSCGQHCRMGKSSREKFSFLMTSLHGPVATILGKNLPISASMGSIFSFSRKPSGDFILSNWRMRSAISSRLFTPSAICMRRSEPNWLMRTGTPFPPFTFSKSSAGPPGRPYFLAAPLETRSAISVISRMGSTSVLIFLSSPARSSAAIHCLKSSKGFIIVVRLQQRMFGRTRDYRVAFGNQPLVKEGDGRHYRFSQKFEPILPISSLCG